MASAASHDQEMPDNVMVRDLLAGVENHTDRVGEAAQNNPDYAGERYLGVDLVRGDDAEPAHSDVGGDGDYRESVREPQLEKYADDGHAPDDGQERPAPTAM